MANLTPPTAIFLPFPSPSPNNLAKLKRLIFPNSVSKLLLQAHLDLQTQNMLMGFQDPQQAFSWRFGGVSHRLQFKDQTFYLMLMFFCLIFLTTFLFLYVHWVCRKRGQDQSSGHTAALPDATVPGAAKPLGLDATTINRLPIVLYCSSAAANETECSICLGAFEDNEKVKVLPKCQHTYHSECVDKWLSTQSSCPLCRASLKIDIPDIESGIP